ncbi:MAG: hypothetical protein H7343_21550 [Undibacterium sp.]|nr:hypothetical protein [Opitutaceae bacterium]
MIHRLSRHGIACAFAWLACTGFCFWTAKGVSVRYHDRENAWHHYEYLVEGFLAGHTHLSRAPAPALLALSDPYDPKANDGFRLWDASLYHGKYYLYYGPAPAVLLMLPWKLLTGHHLPQWAAAATMAAIGLGAAAVLLAAIRKRYFPNVSPPQLFVATVLTAHLAWLPVILRRPAFWELPIVTAAALFWLSLFFLWKYRAAVQRPQWAFAGGLALALAPGARPTYALTAGFMVLMFAWPRPPERLFSARLRRLIPLLVPLALGAGGLIAYNYQRFGAVFEFGQSYQVWGVDFRGMPLFSAGNILANLRVYFFTLPEISPYFPFLRTAVIDSPRAGYLGTEEMPGLLFTMPALCFGIFALLHLARLRHHASANALRTVTLAALIGGVITGTFLFCFGGGCSRYITELLAGWSIVSGIGWLAWRGEIARSASPRALRAAGGILVAWTLAGVWLASFEFRSYARITQPGFYRPVAKFLNYPGHWLAHATGRNFGPVALDIRLAPAFTAGDTVVLSTGRAEMRNVLIVERLAPARVRLRLAVNDIVMIATPRPRGHR